METGSAPAGSMAASEGIGLGRAYLLLAAIVVFWGANWPLTKAVLADIGPLTFTACRLAGAAVVVAALSRAFGLPHLPQPGERLPLAVVGLCQIGGMLGLAAIGLLVVPAGRAGVLAYTMQLWALPLGWLIVGERPGALRIAGAVLAFAGVVVFFDPRLVDWGDPAVLVGNGLLIACAVSWSVGASLYRRRSWRTPFWTQTYWQLAAGAVAVGVAAAALESGRPTAWTPLVFGALVYNWLLASAVCYWWWSQALAAMPASQAGQVTCLVPVVALIISAAVLGETVTPLALVSVGLIVAGIGLSASAPPARRRRP